MSGDTQLLLQVRARGRVAEDQPLLGEAELERLLAHQRRLVEAGEDQLQLPGIGADVADSEDTLAFGLELLGADLDEILVEIEAPFSDRPELHLQPVEGEQRVAGVRLLAGSALDPPRGEPVLLALEPGDLA